jgi:cellulose biosynthesis protein BcsQ
VRVVALYNIKGGVGKTASAVNLAYLSAEAGVRTLLWDLDPQSSATFYFRMEPSLDVRLGKMLRGKRPLETLVRGTDYEGLDVLPADFAYRKLDLALDAAGHPKRRIAELLGPLADHYDHVFLDCAPGISLVSDGVFAAADMLLVPTIPTTLSLRTLDQLETYLEPSRLRVRVAPFFCMVDRRKSLHREIVDAQENRIRGFLEATIPYSSTIERMGEHRAPVAVFAPDGDADRAYRTLWREAMSRAGSWLGWTESLDLRRRARSFLPRRRTRTGS